MVCDQFIWRRIGRNCERGHKLVIIEKGNKFDVAFDIAREFYGVAIINGCKRISIGVEDFVFEIVWVHIVEVIRRYSEVIEISGIESDRVIGVCNEGGDHIEDARREMIGVCHSSIIMQ
jgi:hypothetical protein